MLPSLGTHCQPEHTSGVYVIGALAWHRASDCNEQVRQLCLSAYNSCTVAAVALAMAGGLGETGTSADCASLGPCSADRTGHPEIANM
jgi:hypothetical protein